MSENGHVHLMRKIKTHWAYPMGRFTDMEALVDLILEANWADQKTCGVDLKRGQVWLSIRRLADRWSWSKNKVGLFLNKLEKDGTIFRDTVGDSRNGRKGHCITLVHYNDYNPQRTDDGTLGGHSGDTQGTIKKKKRRKEENIPPTPLKGSGVSDGAEEIALVVLEYFNLKSGRKLKPLETNIKHVKARIREARKSKVELTVEDFRAVIDDRVSDWEDDPKMKKFIRPQTFFNEDMFGDYLERAIQSREPEIPTWQQKGYTSQRDYLRARSREANANA